jgi:hypothetical protein
LDKFSKKVFMQPMWFLRSLRAFGKALPMRFFRSLKGPWSRPYQCDFLGRLGPLVKALPIQFLRALGQGPTNTIFKGPWSRPYQCDFLGRLGPLVKALPMQFLRLLKALGQGLFFLFLNSQTTFIFFYLFIKTIVLQYSRKASL